MENNQEIQQLWAYITNMMTIETFVKSIIIYFFIVWIAIIVWVIRDVTNRSDSMFLQFISILIVLIGTPFGIFIYLLIRPTKTLFEKYYEEVEDNLDELTTSIRKKLKIKKKSKINCPKCSYPIDNNYKFCPNCKEELNFECNSCKKKVDKTWKVCAHCGEKEPLKKEEIKKEKKKK